MKKTVVTLTKKVEVEVPNGELTIVKENRYYSLTYHNPLYAHTPFEVPTKFGLEFSIEEILRSSELMKFMERFQ